MEQKRCLGCMESYDLEYGVCPHCGYVEGTPADEAVHMPPGSVLEGRYAIGKVLGYGGFGATYIAWDTKLEQKVAIKEYLPSEFSTRMPGETTVTVFGGDRSEQFREGMEKFVEEAKRLSKFQNEPGVVKIFDSFQANSTAYIVMEYLDGETLTSYLEREGTVSEETAMEMLMPVMQSLQVVHEASLLHRDIAPDNIFITKDGDVKLIDFGASRYATTSHSRSLTVIIKPGYSPEEQYRSHGDQGPHTDVYALAAVMYKMLTGMTPPDALERRAMIETKKKELLLDIHKKAKHISPIMENAVLNAMNIQIEDRTADIPTFLSELQSPKPVKRRYGKIKKIDVYAWPLWLKILIPAVLVASLTTGVLLMTGVIDFPSLFSGKVVIPEGMTTVPNVEQVESDVAMQTLEDAGLTPVPKGNVESSYVKAGLILLQTPSSGAFAQLGAEIYLTVSSGGEVIGPVNGISTVPYVVWNTQADAEAKLQKAGLKAIITTAYDNNVAVGMVISQSVEANTQVVVDTEITLIVSLGKENTSNNQQQETQNQTTQPQQTQPPATGDIHASGCPFKNGANANVMKPEEAESSWCYVGDDYVQHNFWAQGSEGYCEFRVCYTSSGRMTSKTECYFANNDGMNFTKDISTHYHENGSVYWWIWRDFHSSGCTKSQIWKEYDKSGNFVVETQWEGDAAGNQLKTVQINADGTKCVQESNSSGNIVKMTDYYSNGNVYTIAEYDNYGNQTTHIRYNKDGSVSDSSTFEYDSKGNKSKWIEYNGDGSINMWRTYTYDSSNRLTKTSFYNSDGSLNQIIECDSSGRDTKHAWYKSDGSLDGWRTYEYNTQGQCIKASEYKGESYLYHVIEYDHTNQVEKHIYYNEDGSVDYFYESPMMVN